MSSLGDAFRTIAIQHLAAGGSAEDLHGAVSSLAPPPKLTPNAGITGAWQDGGVDASGVHMVGSAATPVAPPARSPMPQPITEAQIQAVNAGVDARMAGPPAAPISPMAPPLGGAAGQPAGMPGDLSRLAMTGMFGTDPGYNAMGIGDMATGRRHEATALKASGDVGAALDQEAAARADEVRLRGEQAEAETPIREQQATDAAQHADQINEIQQAGQHRIQAQMARYQAAADEAAQAQIHNFFDDKTTGASIMAIISQALSGAANGLAGNPGAPTALDRVIERDIQTQRMNLEQKNKNADRQGNMLGVLRDELGSMTLAENAMYQASLTKTEAMLKQLAPHYAGGIASAQAQQAMAQLAEKKATAQQQAQGFAAQLDTGRGEAEMRLGEASEASKSASFARLAAAHTKEQQDFGARGFHGSIPKASKDNYDKTQMKHYTLQSALQNYEEVMSKPWGLHSYNEIKAADDALTTVMHDYGFSRPAQLEGIVDKLAPGPKAAATNWLDAKNQLHDARKAFAGVYRQSVLGMNPYSRDKPDGLTTDYEDPVMGPLWRESDSDRARQAQGQP